MSGLGCLSQAVHLLELDELVVHLLLPLFQADEVSSTLLQGKEQSIFCLEVSALSNVVSVLVGVDALSEKAGYLCGGSAYITKSMLDNIVVTLDFFI